MTTKVIFAKHPTLDKLKLIIKNNLLQFKPMKMVYNLLVTLVGNRMVMSVTVPHQQTVKFTWTLQLVSTTLQRTLSTKQCADAGNISEHYSFKKKFEIKWCAKKYAIF